MSRHALLIGVTRFSDPKLFGLRAPKSDVEELEAILKDPTRGGFDHVITSIDENLLSIRDKLSDLMDDRHPNDMVLFYYSGHGIVDRRNSLYLATGESQAEKPRARSLSSSEVREMMEHSRAGKLVVVLDCCHSGVFTEGAKGKAPPVNEQTFNPGEGAEGVYVLTATNELEYALDSSGNATNNDAVALSHFTSWLVDGLGRGKAAPNKRFITLDDLYRYLCRRAREAGAPMTPQRYVRRNSGEIVIARNPRGTIPVEIVRRLDSHDKSVRLEAFAELYNLAKTQDNLRHIATKLMRERMINEPDLETSASMLKTLKELLDPVETARLFARLLHRYRSLPRAEPPDE